MRRNQKPDRKTSNTGVAQNELVDGFKSPMGNRRFLEHIGAPVLPTAGEGDGGDATSDDSSLIKSIGGGGARHRR